MSSKYEYKTSSWNQIMKNDSNFHNKYELNTNPKKGPTYIPKTSKKVDNTIIDSQLDDWAGINNGGELI